jgi:hypothetical protein
VGSNRLNDQKLRLLVPGELEDLLPLDDAAAPVAAKPSGPGGRPTFDAAKEDARHDAVVKNTAGEPVALIILGAAHELSGSVRRAGGCEYVRVTTRRVREFAE